MTPDPAGSLGTGDVPSRRLDIIPPAIPVWFGDPARRLAGFFHPPSGAPRPAAVVVCAPFGYEKMTSHRALRHLAQRLAAEGFPVLRFDYEGTGDSSGTDDLPDLIGRWVENVAAARQEVQALSGTSTTCLIGLRLGSLLAAAAASRFPAEDLVLVGPPVSGRAYLREARALQLLRAGGAPRMIHHGATPHPGEDDSIAGYYLSPEARAELSKIDLTRGSRLLAPRAFVASRDDVSGGEDRVCKALSDQGTEVTLSGTSGYADMMQDDPYKSVVPHDLWNQIAEWLARAHAREALPPFLPPPFYSRAEVAGDEGSSGGVVEELVTFEGMHGVLSEAGRAATDSASATGILLLNTGANHRIGSNRMYVAMAREWASLGFRVLRFDVRGIGDSPPAFGRVENDVYTSLGPTDVRAAISFLADRGCTRFVLAGVCSGAYLAYHTALVEPRVRGIVLVNPLTFHWKDGATIEVRTRKTFKSTRFYTRALVDPNEWKRAVRGELHLKAVLGELGSRAASRARPALASAVASLFGRETETSDVARGFRELTSRGVNCLLIYGADDSGIDLIELHLGAGARKLRRAPTFRMQIVDGPDHTFTPLWSQRYLRQLITKYLSTLLA